MFLLAANLLTRLPADGALCLGQSLSALRAGTANFALSQHANGLEERLRSHESEMAALRSECERLRCAVTESHGGSMATAGLEVRQLWGSCGAYVSPASGTRSFAFF